MLKKCVSSECGIGIGGGEVGLMLLVLVVVCSIGVVFVCGVCSVWFIVILVLW